MNSADQISEMYAMYQTGATLAEVATAFGVGKSTVSYRFKRSGLPIRRQSPSVTKKRTAHHVAAMYEVYKDGASLDKVAQVFGVDPSAVALDFRAADYPIRPPKSMTDRRSNEQIRDLHRRWLEGAPIASLAAESGGTANSLRDRMRRMGLSLPSSPGHPDVMRRPTRKRPPDADIRRLHTEHMNGVSIAAISRQLGVRPVTVRKWFFALDLPMRGLRKPVSVNVAELYETYQRGATFNEVAAKYGVAPMTVWRLVEQAGLAGRRNRKEFWQKSTRPYIKRRSPQPIEEMYGRHQEGASIKEIALEFNLSAQHLRTLFVRDGLLIRGAKDQANREMGGVALECASARALLKVGASITEVAGLLAITKEAVATVAAALEDEEPRSENQVRMSVAHQRYSNDESLGVLQTAADELNGWLLPSHYERLRKGRTFPDGRPWPTAGGIRQRFETWAAALYAAGLPVTRAGQRHNQSFEIRDCLSALNRATQDIGHTPTQSDYNGWMRQVAPRPRGVVGELPSSSTIGRIAGTWSDALVQAGLLTKDRPQ